MEKAKIVNNSIKYLVENHTNPDSAHRDCCLWTTNFIQCFEIINSTSGANDSINKKCMNIFIKILTTDVHYELYNKEYSKRSLKDGLWEHANPQLATEAYGHYERVKELYEQFN